MADPFKTPVQKDMWYFISSVNLELPVFKTGPWRQGPHLNRTGNAEAKPDRQWVSRGKHEEEIQKDPVTDRKGR